MSEHPSAPASTPATDLGSGPGPDQPPRPPARIDPPALQRHLGHGGSAWLHGEVARRMGERVGVVRRTPTRVLDWWSPVSASQGLLATLYPDATIVPVGFDGQVLPAAPGRSWWQRWRSAPAGPAGQPAAPAGLLWANMMLHWVDDLPAQLRQWHAAVEVDGFLMFSCFGPDTLLQLRGLYRRLGWGPVGSDWTDMHDLGDALVHAGFADPVMDMEQLTLTWDSPEKLLAELRTLGRNTAPARHAGLRTPRWRERLLQALRQELAGPDGRLHLRFELVYGHAFRPVPRVAMQAQTSISLDDMRQMTRRPAPRP
ncbi:malonyl-CoA O-methyltransferase [Sphaerotilus hippei]|uniref:Malonyl-CoA O-methyltransferase n=1 Tax=Sphaerotilus hippei TaxID=744406 RepID=A0A318H3Q9_9BURK|nr:class I SAM-dependent methyltransferase [Sphaerotilus hippei]PXW95760.1 malonyl-CoA O-methyltransferase [Sphaerotilus hippei]